MNVHLSLIDFFQLLCICQGFTTCLVLFLKVSKTRSNLWLGLLLCGMTLSVLDYFFSNAGIYFRNNNLYFMPVFTSWAFGPLLYYYLHSLFNKKVKVNLINFVPVLVQILFYIFLSLHSLSYKTWFWQHVHKPYTRYIEYYGMCFSVLCYVMYSYKKFGAFIKNAYPLRALLIALLVFFSLALIDPIFNVLYQPPAMPRFYAITFVLPLISFWIVLVHSLTEHFKTNKKHNADETFDPAVLKLIIKKVEGEGFFRDTEITVQTLAARLDITPNTVSKTINNAMGKTFNEYLNELRVAEIKQRLNNRDADKFTLLAIAYDAGFNSKTTFNRVFKQQTGLSPKAYLSQFQNVAV